MFFISALAHGAEKRVHLDGFDLSCPASVNEGGTAACTLKYSGTEAKNWPVAGILHLSSDANRALVRGSPLDLQLATPDPSSEIDGGLWWIGSVLIAYSRFDWEGEASTQASRTVSITIQDDDDYEGEEVFYVSLAASGSRGVGFLYTNRQAITISASDSKSSDAQLQELAIMTDAGEVPLNFAAGTISYAATVAYRATEAVVTPVANHKRATITVNGTRVESGEASRAVSLGMDGTTIDVVVTAENGTTRTYRIVVTRQPRPENVQLEAEGFTLVCPSTVTEGASISCTLANTRVPAAEWPVVAIIHSSVDGDARALIEEDPLIPNSSPAFGVDLSLSETQTPARENYKHGYGELFSGGSTSVYTTYGYQKFDWAGQGASSAERSVVIQTMADDEVESAEIFYIAVAPSGYTGLSRLIDNKAPIIIERKDTTPETPDTTPPAVMSITSSATHPTKDGFTVTITFSEPVMGLTDNEIEVTNGTGSNFAGAGAVYTLDLAPNAGIEDEVTVAVPAGAVVDGVNNGNLEASAAFSVDTKAPMVSTVAITSNPGPDATYAAEDEIRVTVTFSETVEVTGTPQLSLELGEGRPTAALVFAYEVAGGESDPDGVGVEAGSLSGGTIRDGPGNNAVLDHDRLAADAGHKLDAVKPQLAATGGAVADGTTLTLAYDEPLDGSSAPVPGDFTVTGGDQARTVSDAAVSATAVALTLDPAVEHGEAGIQVSYTPGANPIRDAPGNEAEALSREPVTNDTPDTTAPTVSSLAIGSNPGADQTYAAEDVIEVTVTFNETVEVEGTPQLRLRVGSQNRTAGYLRGSGAAELVFAYEVALRDEDHDGVSIDAGRISLNGGSIKDEVGNPAEVAHEALTAQGGHQVDGVRPAFVSAAVNEAELTLTYGEALDGSSRTGTGDFTVEVGGTGRSVTAVSVSGSAVTLTLDPVVEHEDTGITVSYTPGTNPIRDAVGNDALGLSNEPVTNTTGAPNTAPEITSPGPFEVRENQARVTRLMARDADPGDEVTGWAIVGGADQGQFSMASDTGELSFLAMPDYESPADVASGDPASGAGDNEYVVAVRVRSGAGDRELEAERTFTVRVRDGVERSGAPEAPTFSEEMVDSLRVSWSEPENSGPPIGDYDVQYRKGGSGGFTDAQHEGTALTATLTGLKEGTVYEVQVRASNEEGMSDWSEPGEGSTVVPLRVRMTTDPPTPVEGPFTLRFSFSEAVRGFTRGAIAIQPESPCTDSGNNLVSCDPSFTELQTTDDRVFIATVTPQTERVAHNYTLTISVPVRASGVASVVDNKPNEAAAIAVRVAPPRVTVPISSIGSAASPGNGQVTLRWNAPENTGGSAIIRYEYRWMESGGEFSGWMRVGSAARAVTVPNLTNGTEYLFEVRGVNALGYGGVETVPATPSRPPGGGGGSGGVRQTVPSAPRNLLADGEDEQVTLSWEAPEDDGGFAITDYEVRIDGRGSWISIGSTRTAHTVTGLTNGTVYVFQVRAVNAAGSSASSNRAEATPEVFTLDFAHFANGALITSDLVFVNVGTHPIRPVLYFYDQEGQPMAAESMVEVTGDLEIREDGSLSIQTAMEPLGELTISTHGQGELVSGSVKVVAFGAIGGVLRFNLPGIGVAGVGVSPPVRDALFPVRRQEGGINTGVAIHNLGSSAELVRCELMREGVLRDTVSIPLAANGQEAQFIDEMFTAADTSDFAGSVHCDAAGPGMFTAVALELDAVNRLFTTLPVVPVRLAGGRAAALDFAHFANGDGITSDLVFVNPSTERSRPAPTPFHSDILPLRPAIYFYDTEGEPMAAESVVDITGDLEIQEDGSLTVLTEMEPLGVLTISTHGRGALVTGSVKVAADEPIGGVLRFDLPGIGVAGVGVSSPVRDALFPVRRREGGINTGVAVHNLGEEATRVTCRLMQGGTVLEEEEIPLEANGQSSWFINEAFTGTDTSDFAGSVRCTAPGEGMFTGVALELEAVNRLFTTLPVVPVPERASQE